MNKATWPHLKLAKAGKTGFLIDGEIRQAISQGQLISQGAEDSSAKYACYEVHIGPRIQQLVLDQDEGPESDLYREKLIADDQIFRIFPGETFKIYAAEELYMPSDTFAITIPVGNMYKLGLNPETTFADPGFSGQFYVTVCNYSPRVVKLKVGDPLARVFFFVLSERPEKIHESKPRELPPAIERVKRPTESELLKEGESAVLSRIMNKIDPPHFEHAFVTQRIFTHHHDEIEGKLRKYADGLAANTITGVLSLLLILVMTVVYAATLVHRQWPDLFGNLAAEILGALIIWAAIVFGIRPIRRQLFDSVATLRGR
jgi:deoxycytidine triphosphate deaminase